jgi:nucleoside-diphosphate-sugar epimerase
MRVVIAGAHGQVARRLGRLLSSRGDTVSGVVRNPDHRADLEADGVQPVVLDLERASVDDVAAVVSGADAVVFAAGGGPNSGIARKDTVDRGAAVLLADAAVAAGVRPYLLVSSIGVEQVAGGATPEGMDEVFLAYLRAKLAAEEYVLSLEGLAPMVVRPGSLTDEPGTGRVRLEHITERGQVPRDDVAAVLAELLQQPKDGLVAELLSGDTPIAQAVAALP